MIPLLHLPLDFERREDVRRFRRLLGNPDPDMALNVAVLLWLDWGRAGVEFRPLKFAPKPTGTYPWKDDDLTFVIEDFCGATSDPGFLITKAIEATLLRTEQRGVGWGLVLNDFWRYNSHLSPTHKTIQQRGNIAKNARREAKELASAAEKQSQLLQDQTIFAMDIVANPEETKNSIALVMRLDRACGKPLRATSEYLAQKALMTDALKVVRKYSNDDINRVTEYVIANRENPRLVKLTERLLEKFGELLGKASNGG